MASDHDLELVARIQAGTAAGVLVADDPEEVAESATRDGGSALRVDVDDLQAAVAAARVRLAELVVARAGRAGLERPAPPPVDEPTGSGAGQGRGLDPAADRQAVRFALAILVPALAGGVAVHLADGLVLASALPAAALAALGGVVLAHRRPRGPVRVEAASEADTDAPPDPDSTPELRAAEAHLRRQQAAWKLVWWERSEPVPDLASWAPRSGTAPPITLVSVDASRRLDAGGHAATTATAPAAVHLVVLQAREEPRRQEKLEPQPQVR